MVGVSYMDHIIKNKTIWSNFKTDFSENVMYLQEMIDIIGDEPHENLILTISEMQKILNSIGAKGKQVLFIEKFVSQIRPQISGIIKEQLFVEGAKVKQGDILYKKYQKILII